MQMGTRTQPIPIFELGEASAPRQRGADRTAEEPTVVHEPALELASSQTGMAFQRTRMSADCTLMSMIRTSLSLITFGFTIFQVFKSLAKAGTIQASLAPRRFGLAVAVLGVGMLVAGIVAHLRFNAGLRKRRRALMKEGLLRGDDFRASAIVIIAFALLAIGLMAVAGMALRLPPLG